LVAEIGTVGLREIRFACITDVTDLAPGTVARFRLTDDERIDFGRG